MENNVRKPLVANFESHCSLKIWCVNNGDLSGVRGTCERLMWSAVCKRWWKYYPEHLASCFPPFRSITTLLLWLVRPTFKHLIEAVTDHRDHERQLPLIQVVSPNDNDDDDDHDNTLNTNNKNNNTTITIMGQKHNNNNYYYYYGNWQRIPFLNSIV